MRGYTECVLCGKGLKVDSRHTARAVTGWEVPRVAGGLNKLLNRTEVGRYAHLGCVKAEEERMAPVDEAQLTIEGWMK